MSFRILAGLIVVTGLAARAEAACTVSTTSVAFGTYNVFATSDTTSTGTITYRCGSADHDVEITISKGSSPSFSPRTLKKGSEPLTYNLYMDAAQGTIWGEGGSTGTYRNHNPPNNSDVTLTVYGSIPAQQDVSVGAYSDTVVVTINF